MIYESMDLKQFLKIVYYTYDNIAESIDKVLNKFII